jgi:Histidine kinase-, DNA gyrase B-, and HSP90-like ATPase
LLRYTPQNQLFHPFSQENPLQAGTGLGLAIVNSIVTSESVGGKVEVWSEEGVGTEIKVTFSSERSDDDDGISPDMEPLVPDGQNKRPTVSLVGFDTSHQGVKLLHRVLQTYLTSWWGFEIHTGDDYGNIVILNDDPSPVSDATERRDTVRPFIILSASRGNPTMMTIANNYERIGGFCRILYKPGGPSRLRSILKISLHAFKIGSQSREASPAPSLWTKDHVRNSPSFDETERTTPGASIPRRNSEESHRHRHPRRPAMSQRSTTAHPSATTWHSLSSTDEAAETVDPDTVMPTITVGASGSLLRSSIGTVDTTNRKFRVLVVEDNSILRNLL